jgi:hypothetical protein
MIKPSSARHPFHGVQIAMQTSGALFPDTPVGMPRNLTTLVPSASRHKQLFAKPEKKPADRGCSLFERRPERGCARNLQMMSSVDVIGCADRDPWNRAANDRK